MKQLMQRLRGTREQAGEQPTRLPETEPDVTAHPTPIRISKRFRTVLILTVLILAGLLIWYVPSVLTTLVGGFALALVLSFPVRWLSRLMPRGLAILGSFLLLLGLVVLALLILLPLVGEQLAAFADAVPGIASTAEQTLQDTLSFFQQRGLLPSDSDEVASRVREDLTNAVQSVGGNVLGGALGVVTGTFSFALTLFGVLFVGAYLLVDVRRFKAAYLRAAPHAYRRDFLTLWNAFGYSLSKYLGGLALVLTIQGVVSAVGLIFLGVNYALLLGVWVAITAVIPYLGAWIGSIPAVLVALTISPARALLTAVLFLAIQQLEGNFLTPKIQGDTLRVHPIMVFLAVIIGGGLGGIAGVIVAVPSLAVLRVLFDFFRVRLTTQS